MEVENREGKWRWRMGGENWSWKIEVEDVGGGMEAEKAEGDVDQAQFSGSDAAAWKKKDLESKQKT